MSPPPISAVTRQRHHVLLLRRHRTAGHVSALIKKLGGHAVVIGNSMAAGAAALVAVDHPDQVTGLVLVVV